MNQFHGLCFLIPTCAALASSALAETPENLLDHPDFEGVYHDGIAPGWKRFPIRSLVRGSFAEGAGAHGGAQAQVLEVTEAMGAWLQCAAPIRGGIVEGHDYEARVWLKGDRFLQNTALLIHDATAFFPNTHAETTQNLDHDWREVVLRFRAPRTDAKAHFGIRLVQEGRLWIDDASIRELTPADHPAQVSGNLVRNGSFETGLANWVTYWMAARTIDDEKAPHRRRVIELPGGAAGRELQSAAIFAPWGGRATASVWLRGSKAVPVKLRLRHGKQAFAEQEFAVTEEWQRFSLTADLPPLPDGFFHLAIAPGAAVVFADAVQVEVGEKATDFAPQAPIETAVRLDKSILTAGDAVAGQMVTFNAGQDAQTVRFRVRVMDAWEREVFAQALEINAGPGRNEAPLPLPAQFDPGWYRIEVATAGEPGRVLAEQVLALLPALPADRTTLAPLAAQVDYGGADYMTQAGATWTKTWQLGWDTIEPQEGEWRFPKDEQIDAWRAQGFQIMGILSEAPHRQQLRPENALTWGWYTTRDLAAHAEYARRTAEHYAGRISVWELENEPDVHLHPPKGERTAVAYAREALALAEGVRAAQPKARIVLGGGVTMSTDPEKWLTDVLGAQPRLRELCDVFSYHNYSADPAVTRRTVTRLRATMKELGWERPIWDTEWNCTDSVASAYRCSPRHLGTNRVTAERAAAALVQGIVARAGEGLEMNFLYQSYGPGGMATSAFDLFHEADGAPRPALVARAALANQLAGGTAVGPVEFAGCWAYKFRRANGKALVIVWARDTERGPVPWALPTNWLAVDLMGNPLPAAPTSVGPDPIYCREP